MKSVISKLSMVFVLSVVLSMTGPAAHGGLITVDQLVAIDQGSTNLYHVSVADASLTLIGTTGVSDIGSLEYDAADGFLYGITTGVNSSLYRISLADASTTLVGPLGISTFEGGLAFSPDGTAYGVNGGTASSPVLYEIDVTTGAATPIAVFADRRDIDGLGWHGNGLIGLDRISNSLLQINPATAEATTLLVVDPIVGSIGGMVLTGEFSYFATAGPDATAPGSNELFTFDPKTGVHTVVGGFTVNGQPLEGSGISGLAIIPEPVTLVLLTIGGAGLLVTRHRRC